MGLLTYLQRARIVVYSRYFYQSNITTMLGCLLQNHMQSDIDQGSVGPVNEKQSTTVFGLQF